MVVGSSGPRAIGERLTGLYDERGVFRADQPFVVVREATRDEWLAYLAGQGVREPRAAHAHWGPHHFYLVATD